MANTAVLFSDIVFYPLMTILFILGLGWIINHAITKAANFQIVKKPDSDDMDFFATNKARIKEIRGIVIRFIAFLVVMVIVLTAGVAAKNGLLKPDETPQNPKEKERIKNIENHVDQPLKEDVTPKHEEKLKTFDEKMAEEAKKIKDRNSK